MPDTTKLKPIVPAILGLAASLALLAGCTAQNPEVDPEPAEPISEEDAASAAEGGISLFAESSNGTQAEAPPPPTTELPFAQNPTATKAGIPTVDADGNQIDTITGLQRAVEYYQRVLAVREPDDEEEEKYFKPVPPLTNLQQLVDYRVIRAIPKAPEGKKYVFDKDSGLVKLVSQ